MGLTLRDEIKPDVSPLNFLAPIPGTPLENAEPLGAQEILNIIAIYRLMLPTADIKIAGGREINLRDMQSWIFYAGATSMLVGNYLTIAGRSAEDDLAMINDLGLEIVDNSWHLRA
jgi:biotin synthase